MHQYYQGDYWDTGLEQRLRAAAARLEAARERLDRSSATLAEMAESKTVVVERGDPVSPAASYQYRDPRMRKMAGPAAPGEVNIVEIVVRQDKEREHRWQQYLLDFQHYITVKLEHDRLARELEGARLLGPENRAPSETTDIWLPVRPIPAPAQASEPDPLEEYRREASHRLTDATERLKHERTEKAARETLNEMANAQLVGLDDESGMNDAWETVGDVAEELRDQAKRKFSKTCTTQNYRRWLNRRADGQSVGRYQSDEDPLEGVKRLLPPGTHQVRPGDTLSKLAKEYYGEVWLWYVIYERNFGAIPDNPNLILPGLQLEIP